MLIGLTKTEFETRRNKTLIGNVGCTAWALPMFTNVVFKRIFYISVVYTKMGKVTVSKSEY